MIANFQQIITEYNRDEYIRQDSTLNFIASENLPSEEILEANGSILMNKYAEGFSSKETRSNGKSCSRYYQGVEVADKLEKECIDECLKAFGANPNEYNANVQMTSGCMANITVYHALLKQGDKILAPDTASLGHISHSASGSFADTYFNVIKYGLKDDNSEIDYQQVEELALEYKPKLIICGASNYSQPVDFKRFRDIANKVDAYLMADVSHIAGLIVGGKHETPINCADIITSTLHKTLKGVRGAVIIYRKELDKQIRFATIPGLWGGSHLNNTLAKLITFKEAQTPDFINYIERVCQNTKAMADVFLDYDISIISNGTKNHVFCLDLTKTNIDGKELAELLEECGVVSNCNAIPNDTSFIRPHGLRLGGACCTARGLWKNDFIEIAKCIANIIKYFEYNTERDNIKLDILKQDLKDRVNLTTAYHPLKEIYPKMYNNLFNKGE